MNTKNSNMITEDKMKGKQHKKQQKTMNQLRLFTLKYELLKISVSLQTAFGPETHVAEGQ
jgi:hypothetical protein